MGWRFVRGEEAARWAYGKLAAGWCSGWRRAEVLESAKGVLDQVAITAADPSVDDLLLMGDAAGDNRYGARSWQGVSAIAFSSTT